MTREYSLDRYRNFGIMAHIYAVKTSSTLLFLSYTLRSHKLCEVHDVNATLPLMELDQVLGITITSSPPSFYI
mgnify:CR=1 FL=1